MSEGVQNPSPRFRSQAELDELYKQREQKGEANNPYVVECEFGGRKLTFFGARHSSDPTDAQWQILADKWQAFIEHSNKHKLVFCEGSLRPVTDKSLVDSLLTYGEAGMICWLAQHANVFVDSPEPPPTEEISHLRQQGFTDDQLFTYYFARQMWQWQRQDHVKWPDWRAYASDMLKKSQTRVDWGRQIGLEDALKIYREQTGEEFSVDESNKTLYDLSDPAQNPVSAASGRYRDTLLFAAIKEKLEVGYDVFVVYGSTHAMTLEPALDELTSSN